MTRGYLVWRRGQKEPTAEKMCVHLYKGLMHNTRKDYDETVIKKFTLTEEHWLFSLEELCAVFPCPVID